MPSVLQPWVQELPMMQQTVLLTTIRGPDGLPKYGPHKMLLRWFRRCVILSALDGKVLTDPIVANGGSFTGPSLSVRQHFSPLLGHVMVSPVWVWESGMDGIVDQYMRELDSVPHHFHMHLMHAVEILGYKHPDMRIAAWWYAVYVRFVHDMHLWPESMEDLDRRLGDTRAGWEERADPATKE